MITQSITLDLYLPCDQQRDWLLPLIKKIHRKQVINLELLPVELTPVVGYTRLSAVDFSHLEHGDIVLFDHCLLTKSICQLITANSPLATATLAEQTLTIQSMYGVTMEENMEGPLNSEEGHTEHSVQLEDLPIRLHFELGSITLPMSDIKHLAPGQVFEFEGLLDSPVRLKVNGKEIGRGELVKLGDRPGVRVLVI